MKLAIPCPYGCGYYLVMDLRKSRQHIRCDGCCFFCATCPGAASVSLEAAERFLQGQLPRMMHAHLN